MDNITKKTIEYYYNNPRLKELIVDLKTAIEELGDHFTNIHEIIKKLAIRLYEDNICEKDKISQVIKEILADKINEGRVSSKWIEKCLPKEYKRKYIVKSEQSSLSPKRPKTITSAKKEILDAGTEPIFQPEDDSLNPSKIMVLSEEKNEIDEIKELREIISKYQQFVTSDQILTDNSQFLVPKEKFQLIKNVIEKSNKGCYLKFNKNKSLREAQPDT